MRYLDVASGRECRPKLSHDPRPRHEGDLAEPPYDWNMLCSFTFSPDKSILAVGGFGLPPTTDRRSPIHLWDLATGKELHTSPHTGVWSDRCRFLPTERHWPRAGSYLRSGYGMSPPGSRRSPTWVTSGRSGAWPYSPVDGTIFAGGADRTVRGWGSDFGSRARHRRSARSPSLHDGRFSRWEDPPCRHVPRGRVVEPGR